MSNITFDMRRFSVRPNGDLFAQFRPGAMEAAINILPESLAANLLVNPAINGMSVRLGDAQSTGEVTSWLQGAGANPEAIELMQGHILKGMTQNMLRDRDVVAASDAAYNSAGARPASEQIVRA